MTTVTPAQTSSQVADSCELLILGAGIAGMNALFAASRHLGRHDRVMLVDRRPRNGGMWCDTYDYVRLHQPHPMFTAGNLPWTLGAPPHYLASKTEILAHFAQCLALLRERLNLVEVFEYEYLDHREVSDNGSWHVEVRILPLGSAGPARTIRARHCIKAFGYGVTCNPPLHFSSDKVASVSPDDHQLFRSSRSSTKPVYVIGGGKTAMDTAHTLLQEQPQREVHLVVGQGTLFMDRSKVFPTGLKRWWGGTVSSSVFADLAARFDGDNELAMTAYFRERYALKLDDRCTQYLFGLLSPEENDFIRRNIHDYVMDYLDDVVDVDGHPELQFRSGARRRTQAGSVIVNCTGYLFRHGNDYEPYLSGHGTLVSVSPRAGIHLLSTVTSYFLTHLLLLGKLDTLPLYELDQVELTARNKLALPYAIAALSLYNLLLISDEVPMKVMRECGLDFDFWYPLPRLLATKLHLMRHKAGYMVQCRRSLDRIRARYDIHCGVLPQVARHQTCA